MLQCRVCNMCRGVCMWSLTGDYINHNNKHIFLYIYIYIYHYTFFILTLFIDKRNYAICKYIMKHLFRLVEYSLYLQKVFS